MRRRKLWISLAVIVIAAGLAAIVYLRSRSAPEAARLLPECDAVLYVNLRLMRLAHVFGEAPPVSYDPDYEEFVKKTGFQFERDLDYAAFALHAPAGEGGNFFEQARYSEIFTGKFDAQRAAAYFHQLATGSEEYRDVLIYAVPHENRTVRVAILGLGTVAVSNSADAATIHTMIDKYRAAAWPASGPLLVREHYRQVPLASEAWALASIPADMTGGRSFFGLEGWEIPVRSSLAGATIVASARYLGALHLRIEALTRSETDARQLLNTASSFLALVRSAESSMGRGGADPDVKAFFNSLKVEEHGTHVALTATIPQGFIRKALSPPPGAPATPPPGPPSSKKRK